MGVYSQQQALPVIVHQMGENRAICIDKWLLLRA